MTKPFKRLNYESYKYGDIVRLSRGIKGSGGKRFKFVGAFFVNENDKTPEYFELIEIGRGQFRSIRPEFVIKDTAASAEAHARVKPK